MSDSWLYYNSFGFCSPKIIRSDTKMWKTTNPSSGWLAGMVWFINNICRTVCCASITLDVFEIRVNIQQFVLFCAKFSQCICKTSQQTFCVCCFEKFFFCKKIVLWYFCPSPDTKMVEKIVEVFQLFLFRDFRGG